MSIVSHVPIAFGQKNRLVVTLVPTERPTLGPDSRSFVCRGSGSPLGGINGQPLGFGEGGRRRIAVLAVEEKDRPTTAITVEESQRLPKEVPISLRKGATATFGNERLRVESVDPFDAKKEPGIGAIVGSGWKVVVRTLGKSSGNVKYFPVNPFPILLSNGRRVSVDALTKPSLRSKEIPYCLSPLYYSSLPKGAFAFVLDRNPAQVKTISVGASEEHRTKFVDIPMDSKG